MFQAAFDSFWHVAKVLVRLDICQAGASACLCFTVCAEFGSHSLSDYILFGYVWGPSGLSQK